MARINTSSYIGKRCATLGRICRPERRIGRIARAKVRDGDNPAR